MSVSSLRFEPCSSTVCICTPDTLVLVRWCFELAGLLEVSAQAVMLAVIELFSNPAGMQRVCAVNPKCVLLIQLLGIAPVCV